MEAVFAPAFEPVFEPNGGQSRAQVRFLARGKQSTTFLTPEEAVIVPHSDGDHDAGAALRIRWLGANANPEMEGWSPRRSHSNYLLGEDARDWRTNVPNYGAVRYRNLYRGIDLIYKTLGSDFEYDFIVAPGADPAAIRIQFLGQRALRRDTRGALLLELGAGTLTHLHPHVYQEIAGRRTTVTASYFEARPGVFGIHLGDYDRRYELVIDPVLVFSSYAGGRRNDVINGVATDPSGNTYLIGTTTSPDFPVAQALQPDYHETFRDPLGSCHPFDSPFRTACPDAFVMKLDPSGAVLYSTYLGGSSWDQGLSIAADAAGNAYVTGSTEGGFPLANASQSTFGGRSTTQVIVGDAFVAKLDPSGARLIFSTYLGGSFDDQGTAIRADASGAAVVAGWTSSWNFPVRNPLQAENRITNPIVGSNAFIARFESTGALAWSTFLGGSGVVADKALALALDSAGTIYIAGQAASSNFPTTPTALQKTSGGGMDAFIARIGAAGNSLLYSSYLGGARNDSASAIAVDAAGNTYIAGATNSANFPTLRPAQAALAAGDCNGSPCDDAFIAALNSAGDALVFSTYLGGRAADGVAATAVDNSGGLFAAGRTASPDFPATAGSPAYGGVADAFIAKLAPAAGSVRYAQYFGGSGADAATSMALDRSGAIVIAGSTASGDLPTAGAFQDRLAGGVGDFGVPSGDGFIAKFSDNDDQPLGGVALFPAGTVNGASFAPGAAVAPGSIVSAFGASLGVASAAQFLPLPTSLGESSVEIGGFFAPLFFASPAQINFQVPWELQGQARTTIAVSAAGASSTPQTLELASFAPGIFTVTQDGRGQGAVLIAGTAELAAPPGAIPGVAARAAPRGAAVSIFCTGLGAVSNPPPSGWPAQAAPLSATLTSPLVAIGGADARLLFSGLAPGFVGLYQVDVEVPMSASTGEAVPLRLRIGGVSSNAVTIAVN